jgi:3-phenylpropionate/trans-cinnamate dioxygenase ferredoxin subunit
MTSWIRVAAAQDLPDDSALQVKVGEIPVCLARSGGVVYAVHDTCTHADVSLSEGEVEDGTVECWLHGSRFDLATGEPSGLPATVPVATYPTKTDGDDVFVALPR